MFGQEYSSDEETGKTLPMLTHIFAGTRSQQYNEKLNRDRKDKDKKRKLPKIKKGEGLWNKLSLKERWTLAKQALDP